MKIKDFKLERYFAQHEFSTKYLLSSSDCDGYAVADILAIASSDEKSLWDQMSLSYTPCEGSSFLREAIARYYPNLSAENCLVASPGELNFIAMNVLLEKTDHVITISPGYQSLSEVVKSIGCEISYWEPNAENWQFHPADLEKLIQKNTKLIIINFPHNPTGSYISNAGLLQIIEIARSNNAFLFSDEMYHKLVLENTQELPAVATLYEKGISLWGTSKSFGMAGLRTGWVMSQDKNLLQKIQNFKDYLSICTSPPTEILSLIALNHAEHFLLPNLKKIKKNIQLFEQLTLKHPQFFKFIAPQAGSTAFVQINSKSSSIEFSNALVAKTGIMTVPGEMFGYNGKYIRIGFGRENMPIILEKFDKYLNEYGHQI
jgi:aspartate/methionine/tyrosine aminotransferase